MTVEHEPRSLIRAQALIREIHLDVFIRELNRDFFMIPRDQCLHSVITPGNGRARVLQFIERHQRASICELSKLRGIEWMAV